MDIPTYWDSAILTIYSEVCCFSFTEFSGRKVAHIITTKAYVIMAKYVQNITDLSSREAEILQLILNEMTTSEMAAKLYLSHETIRTHRKNLLSKLNARNVAGLVKRAFESGLVSLN
jgi:DNA-binding CsgD family transcriptional regulator